MVECGTADKFNRRTVVARWCGKEHRDRFNPDNARDRRAFAETSLNRFGWPVSSDGIAQIDALVVNQAAARDARDGSDCEHEVARSVTLSDVEERDVDWLWPQRIALGSVTFLAGDPGLGKSFLALDVAARVSTGGPWPDEERATRSEERENPATKHLDPRSSILAPSSVILLSAEDDLATTIRPRLSALGADCSRFRAIDVVTSRHDPSDERPLELDRDVARLAEAIVELGDCRLVVIDPLSAYLGRTNENANAEVRALLRPLTRLARDHQLAVLAISHLRKAEGAGIYKTLGSVAFVAAARAAWLVRQEPQAAHRRLLLPAKNNLASDVGGLAFTIEPHPDSGQPRVVWSPERIDAGAADLTDNRAPAHRPDHERQQAREWLQARLSEGPVAAAEIYQAAEADGLALKTLQRALRDLGGQSFKAKGERHGAWLWGLPAEHQGTQKSDPQTSDHLEREVA
jgi:putative DNA primase/helicase